MIRARSSKFFKMDEIEFGNLENYSGHRNLCAMMGHNDGHMALPFIGHGMWMHPTIAKPVHITKK